MLELNKIHNIDCLDGLKMLEDECIDMVITSPPYDGLRNYNGYSFDFENIAKELYRVMKKGGVIVWIVNDSTIKGSESLTSFKQAIYFKDIGFNIHDTMIWNKNNCSSVGSMNRYESVFEYMFVISKGIPKTANIIMDKANKRFGEFQTGSIRQKDGTVKKTTNYGRKEINQFGRRNNVWSVFPCKSKSERLHPAPFPLNLVRDHIITWSNENDTVLDIFMGSGTSAISCIELERNYIGFEISKEYCEIAENRIKDNKNIFNI